MEGTLKPSILYYHTAQAGAAHAALMTTQPEPKRETDGGAKDRAEGSQV